MSLDVFIKRNWKGFSLDIRFQTNGGVLGILGASGSGKSMTLKCIAGIETPDEGRIASNNRTLFDSAARVNLKSQRRRVGYLFQNYALFPNMTVRQNIGCALGKGHDGQIDHLMENFQLRGLGERYPAQLSGGQQQRVALARCLAPEPEVLLLDEPFSALDIHLRGQVQLELMALLRSYSGQVVLVTHDRDEAYQMCKNMIVVEQGQCIASGGTKALFSRPEWVSVARLTGCRNFSRARRMGSGLVYAEDWGIRLAVAGPIPDGFDAVGIHAHDFKPVAETSSCANVWPIELRECVEGPFSWNVLFAPKGAGLVRSIQWNCEKNAATLTMPSHLSIAPERILLLRSNGQIV